MHAIVKLSRCLLWPSFNLTQLAIRPVFQNPVTYISPVHIFEAIFFSQFTFSHVIISKINYREIHIIFFFFRVNTVKNEVEISQHFFVTPLVWIYTIKSVWEIPKNMKCDVNLTCFTQILYLFGASQADITYAKSIIT